MQSIGPFVRRLDTVECALCARRLVLRLAQQYRQEGGQDVISLRSACAQPRRLDRGEGGLCCVFRLVFVAVEGPSRTHWLHARSTHDKKNEDQKPAGRRRRTDPWGDLTVSA